MKTESGTVQWQRRAQALFALLLYRIAQGPVDIKPFADILQKIASDRIHSVSIDPSILINSIADVDLAKLSKKKRFKRKSEYFQNVYRRYIEETNQPSDISTLTAGDIVSGWAELTGQDKEEFISKVGPKIETLVIERYKTGDSEVKEGSVNDKTEADFSFMTDLFSILMEETSAEIKNSLAAQIMDVILNEGTQSEYKLPNELLSDASTMLMSEVVTKISSALSANPAAKERLLQPLFGALVEMDAKKYGWESGVPADNDAKLHAELKDKGMSLSKRRLSRAVKDLTRRNIFLNIDSALNDELMNDLEKTIQKRTANEQNKTESIWVYEPISPEAEAEAEKRILDFLFRRDGNDTGRNH